MSKQEKVNYSPEFKREAVRLLIESDKPYVETDYTNGKQKLTHTVMKLSQVTANDLNNKMIQKN